MALAWECSHLEQDKCFVPFSHLKLLEIHRIDISAAENLVEIDSFVVFIAHLIHTERMELTSPTTFIQNTNRGGRRYFVCKCLAVTQVGNMGFRPLSSRVHSNPLLLPLREAL